MLLKTLTPVEKKKKKPYCSYSPLRYGLLDTLLFESVIQSIPHVFSWTALGFAYTSSTALALHMNKDHLWQLHNFRIWLLLTNIFRQKITMLKRSTWLRTLMSVCSTAGPHLCSRLHWLPLNTFLHRKLPHGKLFRSTPCVGSPETHPRHQKDRLILNHHDLVPVAMKPMQITK